MDFQQIEKVKAENIPFVLDKKAFYGLVQRVANKRYAEFITVEQITSSSGFDEYEMSDTENGITIKATSGVAASVAFNVYLQDICNYYVGMLTTYGTLPQNPPKIGKVIKNKSLYLYRYFLNYCTFGYTYAFYTWKDWQKVIDHMLLSGYNLVLNPVGQECVWKQLLTELNYTEQEIEKFLVAPNFLPWQLMMNLEDYNGCYPSWWWKERIGLANKINKRLQSFGVGIMLCGYSGMVPNDFNHHFPKAKLKDQGKWCGFDRPKYLLYSDKLFKTVSRKFYRIQNKLLGKNNVHYYSSDPFHEGGITEGIGN